MPLLDRFHQFHRRSLDLTRFQKRFILIPLDSALVAFSLWAAVAVRLGGTWPISVWANGTWLFGAMPLTGIAFFYSLGLYRFVLRTMGRHDVMRIVRGASAAALALSAYAYFDQKLFLPRSTPIIFGLILIVAMVAVRSVLRSYYLWLREQELEQKPVMIYGAGESGTQLAAALQAAREFKPVGFLDDDRSLAGSLISGLRVYPTDQIESVIARTGASEVLLALPSVSRARRKEIIHFLSQRPLKIQTIPSMVEIVSGLEPIEKLRNVGVEDLLGRDAVDPALHLFSSVRGKAVLVTGAGGSIGSELCRQILSTSPSLLVLFELSELALYTIERELIKLSLGTVPLHAYLGSVCDEQRLTEIVSAHRIQTIFHAAAYKHVPLIEANPFEGIRNNIFGTKVVASVARCLGVDRAILVSTDKAVRPTNVMGASKRMAELVFQRAQMESEHTIFSMVRFGNVMGSSGSVIPLFISQIETGGPVTVTHPEITRFFMTIPEAAQLVIQAGSMGKGADVFLLDMGEPVVILDLAKRMIRLSGRDIKNEHHPYGDIEIRVTGLRPGEKLYEELLVDGQGLPTEHPKITRSLDALRDAELIDAALCELQVAMQTSDFKLVKSVFHQAVEGYRYDETISDSRGPG